MLCTSGSLETDSAPDGQYVLSNLETTETITNNWKDDRPPTAKSYLEFGPGRPTSNSLTLFWEKNSLHFASVNQVFELQIIGDMPYFITHESRLGGTVPAVKYPYPGKLDCAGRVSVIHNDTRYYFNVPADGQDAGKVILTTDPDLAYRFSIWEWDKYLEVVTPQYQYGCVEGTCKLVGEGGAYLTDMCEGKCLQRRYNCVSNECVESTDGPYETSDCDGKCKQFSWGNVIVFIIGILALFALGIGIWFRVFKK